MSGLAEVLAKHPFDHQEFRCGCGWKVPEYLSVVFPAYVGHVVEAVGAAGLAVIQLPEPTPIEVIAMKFDDQDGEGPPEAWLTVAVPESWEPQLSMADLNEPVGMRALAGAFLAAANAAKAVNA